MLSFSLKLWQLINQILCEEFRMREMSFEEHSNQCCTADCWLFWFEQQTTNANECSNLFLFVISNRVFIEALFRGSHFIGISGLYEKMDVTENIIIQVKGRLQSMDIKLWLEPYYDVEEQCGRSVEIEASVFISLVSKDLITIVWILEIGEWI